MYIYVARLDRDWTVISGNEAMLRCKTWRKEGGKGRERRAEERRRLDIRVCRLEVRYNRDCIEGK